MTNARRQPPILRGYSKTIQRQPAESQHDKPFIEYRGKSLPVTDIPDQSVSPSMLDELSMDIKSRAQMPPKMTDEALVETAEKYLAQCSPDSIAVTYDQMLLQHIVPELVERLKSTSPETAKKTER